MLAYWKHHTLHCAMLRIKRSQRVSRSQAALVPSHLQGLPCKIMTLQDRWPSGDNPAVKSARSMLVI